MSNRKSGRKRVKERVKNRVKNSVHKKAAQIAEPKTQIEKLRWYLAIIDDFDRKIFYSDKYSNYYDGDEESDVLLDLMIQPENGPDEIDRTELWKIANGDSDEWVSDKQLEWMEDAIKNSYNDWATWIRYSDYHGIYPDLVESLNPATQNSLRKLIPDYKSPDQIRVYQELEKAFDPDEHSKWGIDDFDEFIKVESKNYQKLAKSVINDHEKTIKLIRKHVPYIPHPNERYSYELILAVMGK